jgi:hypothetical protein
LHWPEWNRCGLPRAAEDALTHPPRASTSVTAVSHSAALSQRRGLCVRIRSSYPRAAAQTQLSLPRNAQARAKSAQLAACRVVAPDRPASLLGHAALRTGTTSSARTWPHGATRAGQLRGAAQSAPGPGQPVRYTNAGAADRASLPGSPAFPTIPARCPEPRRIHRRRAEGCVTTVRGWCPQRDRWPPGGVPSGFRRVRRAQPGSAPPTLSYQLATTRPDPPRLSVSASYDSGRLTPRWSAAGAGVPG